MDRDKRWERVKIAVDGLVKGVGEKGEDVVAAIEERYKKDETDEFLKPIIVNGDEGRIKGASARCMRVVCDLTAAPTEGDTLFLFNYRSDRMREIATVLGLPDKPMEVDVPKNLVSNNALKACAVLLTHISIRSTSAQCRATTRSSPFLLLSRPSR